MRGRARHPHDRLGSRYLLCYLHSLVDDVSRGLEVIFVNGLEYDPIHKAVSRIVLRVVQRAVVKDRIRVAVRRQRKLVLETRERCFLIFALLQCLCFWVPVPAIFAGHARRNRFSLRFAQFRRKRNRESGRDTFVLRADHQHLVDLDEELRVHRIRLWGVHGRPD